MVIQPALLVTLNVRKTLKLKTSMTRGEQIKTAVETLRNGGVILCPSDTIASLSCDASDIQALKRIYKIKQRPDSKSPIVLVSSLTMLEAYVSDIPEAAYQIMEATEKPTTIIYSSVRNLPKEVMAEDGSVGIRHVSGGFIKDPIDRFRRPIISTSANESGDKSAVRVSDVDPIISKSVDLRIEIDEYLYEPSSVIKFNRDHSFKIIRK
ncbi:MAG TPA: threonylcarbamoyl-AMP synthase [Flavobacteriales bacterium]|nr:threonylcarbamoyl-AMP synthase [Flavobacteriales bacterium]